jgi:hypothetical protein
MIQITVLKQKKSVIIYLAKFRNISVNTQWIISSENIF